MKQALIDMKRKVQGDWNKKSPLSLEEMLEYCQNNVDTEEQFLVEISGWEKKYPQELVQKTRKEFVRWYDKAEAQWVRNRWTLGMFDSVDEYLVIHNSFVANEFTMVPGNGIFALTGQRQSDPNDMPSYLHPKDLTYMDLCAEMWGPKGKYKAWRPKLDGTPIYPVRGLMTVCGFKGDAEQVRCMEWTPEGLFLLYPYSNEAQKLGTMDVKPHLWRPISEDWHAEKEGVILLSDQGEVRLKQVPSVALQGEFGVWEHGLTPDGVIPLRPRNKPISSLDALQHMLRLTDLHPTVTPYQIIYKKTKERVLETSASLVIGTADGTGYTLEHADGDLMRYKSDQGWITLRPRWIPPAEIPFSPTSCRSLGVKAFFVVGPDIMLYKDGTKLFDMIGGTVEVTDASMECALRREIYEETGSEYGGPINYISTSQDGTHCTVVFQIDPIFTHAERWKPYSPHLPRVQWVDRLVFSVLRNPLRYHDSFRVTSQGSIFINGLFMRGPLMKLHLHYPSEQYEKNLLAHAFFALAELDTAAQVFEQCHRWDLSTGEAASLFSSLDGIWGSESEAISTLISSIVQDFSYDFSPPLLKRYLSSLHPDGLPQRTAPRCQICHCVLVCLSNTPQNCIVCASNASVQRVRKPRKKHKRKKQ